MKAKVSVCVVSYNHEKYIRQAIESIVNQETDFSFEIVIGDDCSTDDTSKILLELKDENPEIINCLIREKNLGPQVNWVKTYNACKGEYIAMCEGDDYWTDTYKLQKQVDFLEANPDFAICFTNYTIKNEFNNCNTVKGLDARSISIEDIIRGNNFSTATSVFKSEYLDFIPDWFNRMKFGDWSLYLYLLHSSSKNAYCLDDNTAVYRIHSGGVHGSLHESNMLLVKAYKHHIAFYKIIKNKLFKGIYNSLINQCINQRRELIRTLLKKEKKTFSTFFNSWF
jgi:glycosyltransferase involved in cell wall biosynthesis